MRRTSGVIYGLSSIDSRGRVVDSKVMRQLGWAPGLALVFSEADGRLIVTPDASADAGRFRVTTQGHLRIPAPLRHLCALMAGDRVLLAAEPARARVTVYPPATLDRLLCGGEAE
jgi:bifunctional DNA-binding transcriptional regulator/antitoxin component of YhaV-PrlF toxin-antitoxin module